MRFFIAGAKGQLGRALGAHLGGDVVWSGDIAELDVQDEAAVARVIRGARPDVVVNAAAYTAVDQAETEVEACFRVNSAGPLYLARAASEAGALLVHVSTDYVFDGKKAQPYVEEDPPWPLSVYGASKLAGEQLVIASGCPYLVVRTSGLFGPGSSQAKGGSFVDRILERARAGKPLKVVSDQVFSPTYAPDLAEAIVSLVRKGSRGLFHVTNSGSCTWHGLAVAALEQAGVGAEAEEIRARDLGAAARRPAHSILSKARYEAQGLPPLRAWSEALKEHLAT